MTVYQVTHKMTLHNQQIRNVYYYETQVGEPSESEWQDIADEIRADYVAEMVSRLVDNWAFDGIDYRVVSTAGLPTLSKTPTSGSIAGSATADSAITQACVVVNVRGNFAKPRLGRTYLGGWYEDAFVDSQVGSGAAGAAETFIDLQTVLNGAGTNPLQRVAAQWNTTHTVLTAWNNISGVSAVATLTPATQRRRRIGVGV